MRGTPTHKTVGLRTIVVPYRNAHEPLTHKNPSLRSHLHEFGESPCVSQCALANSRLVSCRVVSSRLVSPRRVSSRLVSSPLLSSLLFSSLRLLYASPLQHLFSLLRLFCPSSHHPFASSSQHFASLSQPMWWGISSA